MQIQGYKGKGGGRAAVEASDTLRSTQYAEVVDLISEGPIQGLVNGMKSVFLDGVPLVSPDGTQNFEGVYIEGTLGTQGQAALASGFDLIQTEVAVGVEVTHVTPVVRTITNADADTVRVTIGIPQLSFQDPNNGDLKGNSVQFAIELQSNGGGYVEVYNTTIDGKCMSRYQRAIKLPLTGAAPWDLRVTRISSDSTTSNDVRDLWWDSYTEIVSCKLRYPNSAVVGTRVAAQQFNRVPTRAFDVMLRVVQVPSNYDPITRTYAGGWDGTFVPGWTQNPVWIWYDLLLHPRYGLGQYVQAGHLNKWKLYQIAQYCDEQVPDGKGGTEPRFSANLYLQTQEDAYKVLQDLAALFRAITVYANGVVDVVQDAPSDAVSLFTPANVVGKFAYQGGSERTRHSGVIVWRNNIHNLGKREPELYQDKDLVARYGIRNAELSPLGTWSRGEAIRLAKWFLYSEEFEGELVTFTVGSEGALVPIGRVFKIMDPSVAGVRVGGRLKAVDGGDTTTLTLDGPVTLGAGLTYTLHVAVPDPADPMRYTKESRTVVTAAGTTSTLQVTPVFDVEPRPGDVWVLESPALTATTWRCIGLKEVAGRNEWQITGVAHHPGKYALIEQGVQLERRPVSVLSAVAPTPTDLIINETVYTSGPVGRSRITVAWTPPAAGLFYRVSWRYGTGVWQQLPDTSAQTVEVPDLEPGDLQVAVRAVNSLGNVSPPLLGSYLVTGKTDGPDAPTGFYAVGTVNGAHLGWIMPLDPTVRLVQVWMASTGTLGAAAKIAEVAGTAADVVGLTVADGARYFWIRAVDQYGNYSAWQGPASATASEVPSGAINVASFAAGIEPVAIVSTLPIIVGYTGPKVVFLTTDGKLYRLLAGAWTTYVPASDITEQLLAHQLAADSVIAGTVAAAAINTRELAFGAATGDILAVDSVNAANGALADLTVSTLKIQGNAVTVPVASTYGPPGSVFVLSSTAASMTSVSLAVPTGTPLQVAVSGVGILFDQVGLTSGFSIYHEIILDGTDVLYYGYTHHLADVLDMSGVPLEIPFSATIKDAAADGDMHTYSYRSRFLGTIDVDASVVVLHPQIWAMGVKR